MSDIKNLIYAIAADKASDTTSLFESIIKEKMVTKLQEKQKLVAKNMFAKKIKKGEF